MPEKPAQSIPQSHSQLKKGSRPSTRRRARQRAVELIFETEAKGLTYEDVLHEYDQRGAQDDSIRSIPSYSRILIKYLAENQELIDQVIDTHLQDWELRRLPAVDRAIVRLGVAEMLFAADVPLATVIDESVSIAGQLSTDNSPGFVNGILGNIQDVAEEMRSKIVSQLPGDSDLIDTES